jgi:hypothetical protein
MSESPNHSRLEGGNTVLNIITGHAGMLLALQVVLVIIGLNVLGRLLLSFKGSSGIDELAGLLTRPALYYVFPLIVISWLTVVDPTHLLVLIAYYLAALLIGIAELLSLIDIVKQVGKK